MATAKFHVDEFDIDTALVTQLVGEQFPQWAGLPVEPARHQGTDNALYRLGDELSVRLPRRARDQGQAEKDLRWLPRLAPRLPIAIPEPVAIGEPAHGYPSTWGVYRWRDGETATIEPPLDEARAAVELARFLRALQSIPRPADAPAGRARGVPLRVRDTEFRKALAQVDDEIDADAAAALWDDALAAPEYDGEPVWIHGDLIPGNMLIADARVSGIIDFSALCVGDPATDVMIAWTFLTQQTRDEFRAELDVDDAMWLRARGWALSWGVIALPYYLHTNPLIVRDARRAIAEALAS